MVPRTSLKILIIAGMLFCLQAEAVFAAHPLITDDTGTQGKGKVQVEVVCEYGQDSVDGATITSIELPTTPFFSYGLSDTLDVVFGLPYASVTADDGTSANTARGITDASLELKARLYEKDGVSVAVKPGISIPIGDEKKGLGNGRVSYAATFITTLAADRLAYHLNLGYARNEFKLQADRDVNRSDIWNASIAAEAAVLKNLRLVGNIGLERNSDKTSDIHPAFILGGIVYSIQNNLDIDFGIKGGINSAETDLSILAGMAWRY